MNEEIILSETKQLTTNEKELLQKALTDVREEIRDNPYIEEALRVLSVRGYRSAIGSYWNAVVDDLRQKIMHRSLHLFNKEMGASKEVKTYEDFQDNVTDYNLIEGAYKIGVIGWEARRLLHQARETRNVFDGHPASSEPSLIKVLDMISDCNKYVLSQDYPPSIVDIDTYLATLDSSDYDRNEVAVEQALSDLPPVYRTELINKLYNTYTHESSSTILRKNIEFCVPILWSVLPKEDRLQIGRRLDQDIVAGNKQKIEHGKDLNQSIFVVLLLPVKHQRALLRISQNTQITIINCSLYMTRIVRLPTIENLEEILKRRVIVPYVLLDNLEPPKREEAAEYRVRQTCLPSAQAG